ncbi:hypothetical protein ACOSQ2_006946 [Xanthoceras sorbifolium]
MASCTATHCRRILLAVKTCSLVQGVWRAAPRSLAHNPAARGEEEVKNHSRPVSIASKLGDHSSRGVHRDEEAGPETVGNVTNRRYRWLRWLKNSNALAL